MIAPPSHILHPIVISTSLSASLLIISSLPASLPQRTVVLGRLCRKAYKAPKHKTAIVDMLVTLGTPGTYFLFPIHSHRRHVQPGR
ncbi:hypothetical protein H4582DRAFT_1971501 [Lactarius indigo]|nr:hypothetical protein H4582DRAFT_1971501 [Lactarius indigo]